MPSIQNRIPKTGDGERDWTRLDTYERSILAVLYKRDGGSATVAELAFATRISRGSLASALRRLDVHHGAVHDGANFGASGAWTLTEEWLNRHRTPAEPTAPPVRRSPRFGSVAVFVLALLCAVGCDSGPELRVESPPLSQHIVIPTPETEDAPDARDARPSDRTLERFALTLTAADVPAQLRPGVRVVDPERFLAGLRTGLDAERLQRAAALDALATLYRLAQ